MIKRVCTILFIFLFLILPPFLSSEEREEDFEIIFVVDYSGSMRYPSRITDSQMEILPEEIKGKILNYTQHVDNLSMTLNEEELNQLFGGERSLKLLNRSYKKYKKINYSAHPEGELMRLVDREKNDFYYDRGDYLKQYNLTKMYSARKSILNLVYMQQHLNRNNIYSLVTFAYYSEEILNTEKNITLVKTAVESLSKPYDATDMGGGFDRAFKIIDKNFSNESRKILILLSDGRITAGLDPSAIIATYTNLSKQKNVTIFSIGFGVNESEVDSALLKNLSKSTGGFYMFSSNFNKLSQTFLTIGHLNQGNTVIFEGEGQIRQGETKEIGNITSDFKTKEMLITLNWPGSELELKLIDKNGKELPIADDAIEKTSNTIMIDLKRVKMGKYRLVAFGKDVPEGILDYNIIVSEKEYPLSSNPNIIWIISILVLASLFAFVLLKIISKHQKK